MIMKHDYKAEDWAAAKEEMRQILVERAKNGLTIPYTDVVAQIKAIDLPPNSPAFWEMLGEISTAEDAAGRGMLTVLVVHAKGDTLPGAGFFKLARKLGRDVSDKRAFCMQELERVFRCWSTTAEKAAPKGIKGFVMGPYPPVAGYLFHAHGFGKAQVSHEIRVHRSIAGRSQSW